MEIKNDYRIFKIPKGSGQFRTIYIPGERLKSELKAYMPYLLYKNLLLDEHRVCHAFVKGRNCVTNALQHLGYSHSISIDLRSFFDSVKPEHVAGKISYDVIKKCFLDNAPRQGLPTSPLIANIALLDCDKIVIKELRKSSITFAYTRYADDICISVDDEKAILKAKYIVSDVLTDHGFEINRRKTRIQHQANGHRIITGVGVGKDGLYPTRKTKKKIRAAIHQGNINSALGLLEWSKCKLPGICRKKRKESYRRIYNAKHVNCSYCKEGGLVWNIESNNRLILVNNNDGIKHVCPRLPVPISADDLRLRLEQLGFEAFIPQSKTWSAGYLSNVNGRSMFVLFRKNGVDLGVHNYLVSLDRNFDGRVSMIGGRVTDRYTYENETENIHQVILNTAIDVCSVNFENQMNDIFDDIPF